MNRLLDWCLDKAESKVWQWGAKILGVFIVVGFSWWVMSQSSLWGPPQRSLASSAQSERSIVMDDWDKKQAEWTKQKVMLLEKLENQARVIDRLQRHADELRTQVTERQAQLEALQQASVVDNTRLVWPDGHRTLAND